MLLLVALFIVLQPGLFVTIPPIGKKLFGSGKSNWTSILVHAVIFVLVAQWFQFVQEGFTDVYYVSGTINKAVCPPGSYSVSFRSLKYKFTRGCRICPPGTFCKLGVKASCSAGTYSPPGATSCIGTDPGYYSGPASPEQIPCSAGTWSRAGAISCITTKPGYYSGPASPEHIPCRAGTYSRAGATSCIKNDPGYYSGPRAGSQTQCPAGYSCTNPALPPQPCPAGTYSPAGATNCTTIAPDADGSRIPVPPDADGSRIPVPPDADGSRIPVPPVVNTADRVIVSSPGATFPLQNGRVTVGDFVTCNGTDTFKIAEIHYYNNDTTFNIRVIRRGIFYGTIYRLHTCIKV